eukprot:442692-Prorocentrum_minimum.AAC.2
MRRSASRRLGGCRRFVPKRNPNTICLHTLEGRAAYGVFCRKIPLGPAWTAGFRQPGVTVTCRWALQATVRRLVSHTGCRQSAVALQQLELHAGYVGAKL